MMNMEVVGKQPNYQGFDLNLCVVNFVADAAKGGLRKEIWLRSRRLLGRAAVLFTFAALSANASALGLGVMTLHSALGQPLLADIRLANVAGDADDRCFKAVLSTVEGTRLGVVSFSVRTTDAGSNLYLSTKEAVNEPLAQLSVSIICGSQIQHDYQILLDQQPSLPTVDAQNTPAGINHNPIASARDAGNAQSNSATAAAATSHRKSRRRKDDTNSVNAGAPVGTEVAESKPSEISGSSKRHGKNAGKEFRSVLHLGSDPGVEDGLNGVEGMHLMLSHGLNGSNSDLDKKNPDTAPTANAGNATDAPIVAAPDAANANPADTALKDLQTKITRLEKQTEELQRLNAKQQGLLEQAQKEKESQNTFIYLYFLLFASFLAIAWLLWRTRQIQSGINRSWEDAIPDSEIEPEPEPTHEQEIDYFLDEPSPKPEPRIVAPLRSVVKIVDPDVVNEQPAADPDFMSTVVMKRPEEQETSEGDYKFLGNVRSTLPDAEEILDEIQQAEFWMDMQQPQRAIEILESNWGIDRPSSPLPWLYLFDLYRMVGDREKYVELTERFEHIFNGKVVSWEDGELLQNSRSLEDFPFLLKKITQLWGSEDLVPFMENLLIDDRDGRRQGFDLAAYRDILFLTNIAYEIQDDHDSPKMSMKAPEWSVIK